MKPARNQSGAILIFAIWVLALLTVFAADIGLRVRQRAGLVKRLENRVKLRRITDAGVKKAIVTLIKDVELNKGNVTSYGKYLRHNSEDKFRDIVVGAGSFSVVYDYSQDSPVNFAPRYGFVDEESKINLNVVSPKDLQRLIEIVVTIDEAQAKDLADAIIDWRKFGESSIDGLSRDDFYRNLEEPYPPKDAQFEHLEELFLVEGITPDIYDRLKHFVTVYGDGKININTAPRVVLLASGFIDPVADKILLVRRGLDGMEGTVDDFIFQKNFDIASDLSRFVEIDVNEARHIDQLNTAGKIKTVSYYYLINSQGRLGNGNEVLRINCVYNLKDKWIEYWREK